MIKPTVVYSGNGRGPITHAATWMNPKNTVLNRSQTHRLDTGGLHFYETLMTNLIHMVRKSKSVTGARELLRENEDFVGMVEMYGLDFAGGYRLYTFT